MGLFCLGALNVHAAEEPVILLVRTGKQTSPERAKFIQQLAQTLAKVSQNGSPLFADPYAQKGQSPDEIEGLERMAGHTLGFANELYIYETWDQSKKGTKVSLQGFALASAPRDSQAVTYFGYLQAINAMEMLEATQATSDADGFADISLLHQLLIHDFDFEVIQYGQQIFRGAKGGDKVKAQFYKSPVLNLKSKANPTKRVVYTLQADATNQDLLNRLQRYLRDHPEETSNLLKEVIRTDEKVPSYTNMSISSVWKLGEAEDGTKTVQIQVDTVYYVIGKKLKLGYPYDVLKTWTLDGAQTDAASEIAAASGGLNLLQINSQAILPAKSGLYLQGLRSGEWNHLNQYVKDANDQ